MHYRQGYQKGSGEILLYKGNNELIECGTCDAYILKKGVVAAPPLDHPILPGITRRLILKVLREDGSIPLKERVVTSDR